MGNSDEESFYGTPLPTLDEDEVPRKKPIPVQDQIATDKHGRRRFHGAFTGGFSAGFYNSVGTQEGWTPSTFKSSRETKADSKYQKPEDFMDDEDTDEFGFAPSVLRAKPEYGGSKAKKRERVTFSDGPIPGEPVLRNILQPARETIGVLLLMKMGWKPGQGIGPRLTKLQKNMQRKKAGLFDFANDDELDIDVKNLFAPDDIESFFLKPKSDRFGMGYVGLDKEVFTLFPSSDNTFRLLDAQNRKLAIKGQAFGVGAFEEDDADIYERDDMTKYDFSLDTAATLKEKRRKERESKRLLAISYGGNIVEGFVPAKKQGFKKKYFPPPRLPAGYDGMKKGRKSRFGPQIVPVLTMASKKSHTISAMDREAILSETRIVKANQEKNQSITPVSILASTEKNVQKVNEEKVENKEEPVIPDFVDVEQLASEKGFKPFLSDPLKQARYEKYLHFIKIGAKEAFQTVQPKIMSEWEKERERSEFEQASRLYKPLSGMMADRFATAELPDESLDPLAPVQKYSGGVDVQMAEAVKDKKYGLLTRKVYEWAPVSLLCKRMNIAEPTTSGGISLCDVAKDKNVSSKPKFNLFNFLGDSKKPFDKPIKKKELEIEEIEKIEQVDEIKEILIEKVPIETNEEEFIPLKVSPQKLSLEEQKEKEDLFKAIFCSSDESDEEPETNANVLRNTSPPRGIFANLDLDAMKPKTPPPKNDLPDMYGPSLPTAPLYNIKQTVKSSSSDSEVEWVEKSDDKKNKKHKKKKDKHKKNKKEKKKHKHKKDKKLLIIVQK